MRVSTLSFQNRSVNSLLEQQAKLGDIQEQIATGKKLLDSSDDPVSAVQIVNLTQKLEQIERYDSNINAAINDLNTEDDLLNNYVTTVQRVRELAIQAGNGALKTSDRQVIAIELRERLKEMLSIANTKNANGAYMFGGFQTSAPPFAANNNNVYRYAGNEGQRVAQLNDTVTVQVNDSGKDLFGDIAVASGSFATYDGSGNAGTGLIDGGKITGLTDWQVAVANQDKYTLTINGTVPLTFDVTESAAPSTPITGFDNATFTAGQDIVISGLTVKLTGTPEAGDTFTIRTANTQNVFNTIERFASSLDRLADTDGDAAILDYELSNMLDNLDTMDDVVNTNIARVGARLSLIDSQTEINSSIKLLTQTILSEKTALDYTEAVSQLSQQSFSLEAAQRSYSTIARLTLFNFL